MRSDQNESNCSFQLTHSRGVRPPFVPYPDAEMVISTHALTWSATLYMINYVILLDFNSRTHVECDRRRTRRTGCPTISTHALTWSATQSVFNSASLSFDFNSRTHVECDVLGTIFKSDKLNFNSRTHVECDFSQMTKFLKHPISTHALTWSATTGKNPKTKKEKDFNSRTHVECDKWEKALHFPQMISTHALTWSATFLSCHFAN